MNVQWQQIFKDELAIYNDINNARESLELEMRSKYTKQLEIFEKFPPFSVLGSKAICRRVQEIKHITIECASRLSE